MDITGGTAVLFILCDPVVHVRGTALFNHHFESECIDAAFSPLHVLPGDLPTVVTALRRSQNVAGFGVTIPHKIAVVPLLDELTDSAQRVGSVNFVRRTAEGRLTGTNIDGEGFLVGLANRGIDVAGKRILQFGAGGAGRAVAFATALAGAASITLVNRTISRAESLASAVRDVAPYVRVEASPAADPREFDLVFNATPNGMRGQSAAAPCNLSALPDEGAVAEIIITPEETPLVRAARAKGLQASIGRDMLTGQYELMRDFLGLKESVLSA